ncbi:MAG: sigma-54 dependent transcriptional regulator [Saprospiraceae bacterium]|nr:sigma-54 dependent transcriptional regulator [Saprospiraceae bacterium]
MNHTTNILIVDDEEDIILSLKILLKQHYSHVFGGTNPQHLPRLLEQHEPDIVMLDMNFRPGQQDGKEGLMWLEKIKELRPNTEVVMITAYSEVDKVVAALKTGATDFIEKPWHNEKVLATLHSITMLVESRKNEQKEKAHSSLLREQIQSLRSHVIGESPQMEEVKKMVEKLAPTDANILIRGENGTGKEVIARKLHELSGRREAPFITIDLGAIPDELFESELFGFKKGAFTDAKTDKIGRIVAADGGTLFMDEIGNLSKKNQAKLLAVLQNKLVMPLGGTKAKAVDIRLICASNAPLEKMVKEETFRQDLLYRINTVEINLPPLRQREGDIKLLVNHFLKQHKQKYKKPQVTVTADALQQLRRYDWPGNVRELEHAVERAVILSEGPHLDVAYMLNSSKSVNEMIDETFTLEEAEKKIIQHHLQTTGGNISKAAAELGITRAALYRRMKKHEI